MEGKLTYDGDNASVEPHYLKLVEKDRDSRVFIGKLEFSSNTPLIEEF